MKITNFVTCSLLTALHTARRRPRLAWVIAFAFFLATPFAPAPWAVNLAAQTYTMNSTTAAAAIAATDTSISVTSASAASGSSFGSIAVGQQIYVVELPLGGRGEVMAVTSVSSTTIGVQRRDRPRAHPSGALVFIGNAAAFMHAEPPNGSCTTGNQGDPWINVDSGSIWRCTSSLWARALADDALVGLPKPAAATALTGANVLSITGGAGGAQSATTGNGGAGGAPALTGGVGGAAGTSSGTGGAGGAVTATGGVGGGTVTGGAGGAITATGGAGAAGSTTPGAGGAVAVVGGAAGLSTASAGTGSIGGTAALTGGAGSVASTGAATGGAGGAATVAGGAGGGTITGGAGGNAILKGGAGANGSTAGGSGGDAILQAGAVGTGGTGAAGTIKLKDAADATKVLSVVLSGATTATTTTLNVSQGAASALTLPGPTSGGIPVIFDCGSTGSGNQTCSAAAATVQTKLYVGHSTLASNAAVITFSPGFTGTTTYDCVANDITTRANPVQMIPASASTATITNTTGASDVINWICAGN